ncbi:methyltransferase domain-containing protein [Dactylosporangium sp. NPDC005572]|uniref:class I SAM-dependent methyltransferase n=1 Tax=Dactylosporangium sp. NPDC005572 TaxID=3156889 RepID=UPI0033BDB836
MSDTTRIDERSAFLREFLRDPFTVAAVTPSGTPLAHLATAGIPRTGHPTVAELGPGTGAFTRAIQRRLDGRGHHLAIEINQRFADLLTHRHPNIHIAVTDARNLRTVLTTHNHHHADVIISGLPWAAFSPSQQDDLLNAVTAALAPHGVFTTFAYTHTQWAPPARRLRQSLQDRFEEVISSRTIWNNLPPAFVYYCRRPRTPATTPYPHSSEQDPVS